jgi:hypothetical protein
MSVNLVVWAVDFKFGGDLSISQFILAQEFRTKATKSCYNLLDGSTILFFIKERNMNELINLIIKKTGIPAATAQTIVKIVIDFLKKKLPAPVGAQIDGLLNNATAVKTAENVLGSLASNFGKKKK